MMPKTLAFAILFTALTAPQISYGNPFMPMGAEKVFQFAPMPENGKKARIIVISSGKPYNDQIESEVAEKLESEVNGGRYNVISIKTIYTPGFLAAAEIVYDDSGSGAGNKVRLKLLLASQFQRQGEIQKELEKTVNSGMHDIIKIQTTYSRGFLIGAEIYYKVN